MHHQRLAPAAADRLHQLVKHPALGAVADQLRRVARHRQIPRAMLAVVMAPPAASVALRRRGVFIASGRFRYR
jgi:hypothetical protein